MANTDFEKILLEAVDEGLAAMGESSKQAVYYHLEKGFDLKREKIPRKIEAFILAIEKLFGMGASFLEKLILKGLYEKTGLKSEENSFKNLTFVETVAAVKKTLEQ